MNKKLDVKLVSWNFARGNGFLFVALTYTYRWSKKHSTSQGQKWEGKRICVHWVQGPDQPWGKRSITHLVTAPTSSLFGPSVFVRFIWYQLVTKGVYLQRGIKILRDLEERGTLLMPRCAPPEWFSIEMGCNATPCSVFAVKKWGWSEGKGRTRRVYEL